MGFAPGRREEGMVYLDNNATTPLDPAVSERMCEFLKTEYGNPSSLYPLGRRVKDQVQSAREAVAGFIGASRSEVFFTGSGTEADNFAILGVMDSFPDRREFVTSAIEHPAIMETGRYLEGRGYRVTYVPVDSQGLIDLDFLRDALTPATALVSIMQVNNEIGTIQPIEAAAALARDKGVLFHTDAVQALGKVDFQVDRLGVDLLSVSAHKIYGPKGIGALYIRKGTNIRPFVHGGHQERSLRAGTENTSGIVGFGQAIRVLEGQHKKDRDRTARLSARLKKGIEECIPRVQFNGHPERRTLNTLNFAFPGLEAESILLSLATQDICVSTGSACSSESEEVSHVLAAIGLKPEIARSCIRFSLGRFNTDQDIDTVLSVLPEIVDKLRRISSYEPE
jgi:cysteine desulfurase